MSDDFSHDDNSHYDRYGSDDVATGRRRTSNRGRGRPVGENGEPFELKGSPETLAVRAKDVCLRLLTERARSRAELDQKLVQKGYPRAVIDTVLDRLAEVGLVDDAAFAEQWVHSRHTYSGRGRRALATELRRKGIDQQTSTEALSQISADDEHERAAELVRKKLARTTAADIADRDDRDRLMRRLVGMLARRGYPASLSFNVVKTELANLGAETDGLAED
ncbi:recombination regulator RecX [Prescottella agglutinans]|uniref:Regulatory protein RecX n=1 Tax=Prescottella agglutinans TaxID=1644129 RepID=A0A438BFA6_9NOCA|nr:recombination regulator RecX [Prescottella agglutinans]RVW09706.1 recombination regulator RecX [Prescottella agglutinans]